MSDPVPYEWRDLIPIYGFRRFVQRVEHAYDLQPRQWPPLPETLKGLQLGLYNYASVFALLGTVDGIEAILKG